MAVEIRRPVWDGVTREGHAQWMLQQYRNLYAGHRVFIIGTGPSLKLVPRSLLERLADEYTFGVNLVLRCDLPFLPSMLGIMISEWHWVDGKGIDWMIDQLKETKGGDGKLPPLRFYAHEIPMNGLEKAGWQYVRCFQGKRVEDGAFGGLDTYLRRIGFGYSVIIAAVQIVCWLGFDPIYLLGCDGTNSGHAYAETKELDERGDQTYFHICAERAEREMMKAGRTLLDLTEGGKLPVSKGSLGKVLEGMCMGCVMDAQRV